MVIDGHAHACGSYGGVNAICEHMKRHGIDKVILCGGEPNSARDYNYPMVSNIVTNEKLGYFFNKIICKVSKLHKLSESIDQQNQFVYELASALKRQVFNAYWINPTEVNCIEKLKKFYDEKDFCLIKMHQCWTDFDLESEKCHKLFQLAKEIRKPIFIHLSSHRQVIAFIQMANLYSDINFIVAHMIGADFMAGKLCNNNVYFDLSAPQLYSVKILKHTLKSYGAKRLLLGSDTPYGKNNIEFTIQRLRELNLSKEDLQDITGNNLVELIGL